MAEMDSVVCFEHPDCNPQTGAAHACGHSIQMAVAMGAFFSLKESGALAQLSGSVTLLFVPAEECVETEWRLDEIKKANCITWVENKNFCIGELSKMWMW